MSETDPLSFPPAGWPERLLAFYRSDSRDLPWRKTRDPYAIYVSEIMLQQTQVQTVIPYYKRFLARFPDLESLAAADQDELHKYWEGLGYYARARQMQKAACQMVANHDARVPSDPTLLLALPGIGAYTAGAIGSIAFGHPVPAVDGNVVRVIARLYGLSLTQGSPADRDTVARVVEPLIPRAAPGDFNQALMEFGALICTPASPKCMRCLLQADCVAYSQGRVAELPLKPSKKTVAEDRFTVVVLKAGARYRVSRRKQALLSGLYQFDLLPGRLDERDVRTWVMAQLPDLDLSENTVQDRDPVLITALPDRIHRFTHRLWRLSGFLVSVEKQGEASVLATVQDGDSTGSFSFVTAGELRQLPFPTALSAYREDVLEHGG